MKKIAKFAMVVVAMLAMGCSEPDHNGTLFLEVTYSNVAGVWRLESYDNGVELGEGTYRYIVLDRKEHRFVTYDNLGSMEQVTRTGRFDIYTDAAAIIRGSFDYGQGDWVHRYYVRNLTTDSMVWVATDDESISQVYVRAELPEWIETEE
jgi:hypothetical protein